MSIILGVNLYCFIIAFICFYCCNFVLEYFRKQIPNYLHSFNCRYFYSSLENYLENRSKLIKRETVNKIYVKILYHKFKPYIHFNKLNKEYKCIIHNYFN